MTFYAVTHHLFPKRSCFPSSQNKREKRCDKTAVLDILSEQVQKANVFRKGIGFQHLWVLGLYWRNENFFLVYGFIVSPAQSYMLQRARYSFFLQLSRLAQAAQLCNILSREIRWISYCLLSLFNVVLLETNFKTGMQRVAYKCISRLDSLKIFTLYQLVNSVFKSIRTPPFPTKTLWLEGE